MTSRIVMPSSSTARAASDSHGLIPDAALAALAIEHGVTLASTDTDFARFRGLRWENPLN
jgi:predicted nucleic acid-binding protein